MYSIYQLIIGCLVGYVVGWLTMIVYYKITESKKFGGYIYPCEREGDNK